MTRRVVVAVASSASVVAVALFSPSIIGRPVRVCRERRGKEKEEQKKKSSRKPSGLYLCFLATCFSLLLLFCFIASHTQKASIASWSVHVESRFSPWSLPPSRA